jgi:hypothetical protein
MKNFIFFVFFTAFAFQFKIYAQAKPFLGYDKVPWSASIDSVRKIYLISDEIVGVVSDDDSNIVTITQENVSNSLKFRIFTFNNDKLYRVVVGYNDNGYPADMVRLLKTQLEKTYGKGTDSNEQDVIATFENHSPGIEVELRVFSPVYYTNDSESYLSVWYTWKRFRDEYISSLLEF